MIYDIIFIRGLPSFLIYTFNFDISIIFFHDLL